MERRYIHRSKVSTTVYLAAPGTQSVRCLATNLSGKGVYLRANALGLPVGATVELVFAVSLGDLIRLHRRKAIVTHVANRGAGLMLKDRSPILGRQVGACGGAH